MNTSANAQIGVTGLAVMGRNLARNFARHGHTVALHNRTQSRVDDLVRDFGDEGSFVPSSSTEEFVASLEKATKRPSGVMAGLPESSSAFPPPNAADTSSSRSSKRSNTNTS